MGTARLARIISEIMRGTGPAEYGAGRAWGWRVRGSRGEG
jgi:hypothetical protein